ncbi:MAG: MFS transporter [Chloroflexi bacterium]|nr:MFS transporter [Chloroflexota bacterium]
MADSPPPPEGVAAARGRAGVGARPGIRARLAAMPLLATFALRDFPFYWLGTLAYFTVFGAQRFVFIWLVLEISGRAGLAGVVGFALGIPAFFITLPAGVWADRMNRGRLVALVSLVAAAGAIATAGSVWVGVINIPLALLSALALGAAGAVLQPALTAIISAIVPRELLMNGIVLRTMGQNLAQIVGASVGGAAIALWGFGAAFALQAMLYALTSLAMFAVRVPMVSARAGAPRAMLPQVLEGLRFVFGNPALRALMAIMVISGLFMLGPVFVLVPDIARVKLGEGAFSASMLFAVTGAGMFLMSAAIGSLRRLERKGQIFTLNMIIFAPIVLIGMGLAPWYTLLAFFMFAWGLGGGAFINLNQTLLQSNTPDHLMGRVMSISSLAIAGVIPLGSLLAGAAAEVVGADRYLVFCGLAIFVTALAAYLAEPALLHLD